MMCKCFATLFFNFSNILKKKIICPVCEYSMQYWKIWSIAYFRFYTEVIWSRSRSLSQLKNDKIGRKHIYKNKFYHDSSETSKQSYEHWSEASVSKILRNKLDWNNCKWKDTLLWYKLLSLTLTHSNENLTKVILV